MTQKILIVDDDANLLSAYRRQLRKLAHVHTAMGGAKGLEVMKFEGPFDVIVADYRMPGMDGIEFLKQAKVLDPSAVTIMLTGQADTSLVITAVNSGDLFRFLTKPCKPPQLQEVIKAGLKQAGLIKAEKELLEKTLSGSIRMLIDVLSSFSPEAFNKALRIKSLAMTLGEALDYSKTWQLEISAMLSQIGFVAMPGEIFRKKTTGKALTEEEETIYAEYPLLGARLIQHIPRLEEAARAIQYQEYPFDGEESPKGGDLPAISRILKPILDYDRMVEANIPLKVIKERMRDNASAYDPAVYIAFCDKVYVKPRTLVRKDLKVADLQPGMITATKVRTTKGLTLMPDGMEITALLIMKLRNFSRNDMLIEPVGVMVPKDE